jgi:Xaa-Pro aminopeptidase
MFSLFYTNEKQIFLSFINIQFFMSTAIKRIQQYLCEQKIDSALFIAGEQQNSDITYYTAIPALTHAALIIPQNGRPTLYVTSLDYGRAQKSGVSCVCLTKSFLSMVKEKMGTKKIRSISIPFSLSFSVIKKVKDAFPSAKLYDITTEQRRIRSIKTAKELKLIKKAASISNIAFRKTIKKWKYKTEAEVKASLEFEMIKRGATPSFPTIVASGRNASVPHHITSLHRLKRGFCIIDFGARYKGYCSDCTRTVFIGKPTTKQIELYELVCAVQKNALRKICPDNSCSAIDTIARSQLGDTQQYFTHSLGHGIGVDVHEAPNLSPKSRSHLKKNMVVTVEPGIYKSKQWGIRIEDTIIVRKSPINLTPLPKHLLSFRR